MTGERWKKMDRQFKNVLEAILKMLKAMGEHTRYLHDNDCFTDHPYCWQLIEDIRGACMTILNTMNMIERKIQAAGLRPPKEE